MTRESPSVSRLAWLAFVSISVCLCLGLTACSMELPEQADIPPVKRRQNAKAPPLEALFPKTDDEPYAYNASNRRDPFIPLIADTPPAVAQSEDRVNCPPLQDFELASLKLTAIVWGDLGRKAMFKAPNGRGYSVTEEMLIGRNCGRVRRIESNAVVIEESRKDSQGKVLKEEVVLRLREQEG
jgi:Tfp pilus assembly protein PilP